MKFGEAVQAMEEGKLLARKGWNGKGMFVYKTIGNTVPYESIIKFVSIPESVKTFLISRGRDVIFHPSITMYTALGEMQPGWLASQADILADDWEIFQSQTTKDRNEP